MASSKTYVAWGYIAGAALHHGLRLKDGNGWFELTATPPESFRRLPPPGVVESGMSGGFYVTGVRRQPRVGSDVAFQLTVDATDPEVAFVTAQDRILPMYLAGMSSIAEQPLFGAVVAVHEDGDPEGWLPRVASAEMRFFPNPRILSADELAPLAGLVWSARHDATGRLAATEFHAANMYLGCRTGDSADDQAILSTYFFVIERIAKRLGKDRPLQIDPGDAQEQIDQLQRRLSDGGELAVQIKAVVDTAGVLRGMSTRGMRRGVRDAGTELGVASGTIEDAVKFTDLRNSRLGHPAPLGEHSVELERWLPRAQACAMAYLAAYLRWVYQQRGYADPAE